MHNISNLALKILEGFSENKSLLLSSLESKMGFSKAISKSIVEELEFRGLVKYTGNGIYILTEEGFRILKK